MPTYIALNAYRILNAYFQYLKCQLISILISNYNIVKHI